MIAVWLALIAPGFAEEPPVGGEIVEQAPVMPPKLLEQVVLHYPEAALAEQAHGDVTVIVHVDETGKVVDAEFENGLDVFRAEALRSARRLVFAPATQDGVPVPALTRVFFHFAPPEHEHPEPVYEIEVAGATADELDTHARETLDEAALDHQSGQDLAEAVGDIAGVTLSRGTAETSKPIIRGQVERRLLLLHDGIRHESQKWGVDHAPEIDPFSAGQISVVKGAAGVRYGPDAIGGVILVDAPEMRQEPGFGGKVLAMGATNGRKGYAAARLDWAPTDTLSLRVEGNGVRSASQTTPDYVLGNTATAGFNLGGAAEWRPGITTVELGYRHYHLDAGVFYGIQNSTPAEFGDQLDEPLNADAWRVDYTLDDPRQRVTHDLASLRVNTPLSSFGDLTATYAFQLNHRQEYEQTRASITGPQYDFVLRTHSLDAEITHHAHALEAAALEGGVGLATSFQENVYSGLPLVPNFRGLAGGLHAYERLTWDRTAIEAGARLDAMSRTAYLTESSYERHLRRGTLDPDSCSYDGDVATCPRGWTTASASLGGLWQIVPGQLDAKLDLSSASRFPNVDELFLNGSAPSFPVYALGNPDLKAETTWGASPTLGLRLPWLQAEASAYGNLVQRYIYFAPEFTDDGEPAFDVTIRGAFPRYGFTPVDAVFYGADAQLELLPDAVVGLKATGALVRGQRLDTGDHLVGIPADQLSVTGIVRPPEPGPLADPFVEVRLDAVGRQSRVDADQDFAPAPDGYLLVGARAGTTLTGGAVDWNLSVELSNLTNTRYREYTSLLRYYADMPGRDLRFRVGATF